MHVATNEPSRLIAGAMSGTSADGVDVAIVRIVGSGMTMRATIVHHLAHAFDASLKQKIFAIRGSGTVALRDLAELAHDLSLAYATAINAALRAAHLSADALTAIAAHGQTLFHAPPLTIQWLDPALLAARVGCPVVSDFRRADCAAGGQGAPLVPFADYIVFRDAAKHRVLLNIGGIANLSSIPAGGAIDDVIAFDTGPGNCISDHLCRQLDPTGPGYDANGARAMAGQVDARLVESVMAADYFRQPPPKSTDVPTMIDLFERARATAGTPLPAADLLATACAITAASILTAFRAAVGDAPAEWVVSGGGANNGAIMRALGQRVPTLLRSEDLGVDAAAKEALAFALLGAATLDGEPGNLPSVTGASRRVVGGTVTPRPG
ncbi:MAG TPA: anhydro-N-acetylmuramic acid kinase [Tepidisphaeraceae bacterium]|jgi:anhydro-N-acetylmuramic acid kinase|nr:anhydro-N-acetylmuramic acid kinase [Tepidisphaeraceae bacterium]